MIAKIVKFSSDQIKALCLFEIHQNVSLWLHVDNFEQEIAEKLHVFYVVPLNQLLNLLQVSSNYIIGVG